MKYSIYNDINDVRFSSGKNIENTYIDWQIKSNIKDLFKKYLSSYIVKNDVSIFDFSYFQWLAKNFYNNSFQFNFSNYDSFKIDIIEEINRQRTEYYRNQDLPDDTEDFYSLATKDIQNLDAFFNEILAKNSLIIEEFKDFVYHFNDFVENTLSEEYSKFNTYYNILLDDLKYFKNTQIQSLSKYKFTIGTHTQKNSGARGKTDDFVPGGMCYYGEKIFINSDHISRSYGSIWFKRNIKHIFYHEIGHALDYLYFNESSLKDGIKRKNCGHNDEFLNICKKNYLKFKKMSSHLPKKQVLRLSYYLNPVVKQFEEPYVFIEEETIPTHEDSLFDKFKESCLELNPLEQYIYEPPKIKDKKFSSIINKGKFSLNFSRPLEESWAECFAFLFRWMKDGFNEYDQFILKANRSYERLFVKLQYNSFIYLLDNFDWRKLNISYTVYLKRKRQIKLFLNHVNDMPLFFYRKPYKVTHKKTYLSYHDLIKHR